MSVYVVIGGRAHRVPEWVRNFTRATVMIAFTGLDLFAIFIAIADAADFLLASLNSTYP